MDIVIHIRPAEDAPACLDLGHNGLCNHIPRRQIQQRRGIAFHKAFVFAVFEDAAFAANALGDQNTHPANAGGMKLKELHILQRQAAPGQHRRAVAGVGKGVGGGLVHPPEAAGRDQDRLGMKNVQVAGRQLQRQRRGFARPAERRADELSKKATSLLMHC